MLKDIGIHKLSKYHLYKNEIVKYTKYRDDAIKTFGCVEKFPPEIRYCIEREKARIERYALENAIQDISNEIVTINGA